MDDELRRLERAALAGDAGAAAALEAARARAGLRRAHAGSWGSHDDDCWCAMAGGYCNRGGWVWSCCGACKEDSECSAPRMHPTHWQHPKHGQTTAGYRGVWPVYRSDAEIRALAPEAFEG